jgi:hypothetical protein
VCVRKEELVVERKTQESRFDGERARVRRLRVNVKIAVERRTRLLKIDGVPVFGPLDITPSVRSNVDRERGGST